MSDQVNVRLITQHLFAGYPQFRIGYILFILVGEKTMQMWIAQRPDSELDWP